MSDMTDAELESIPKCFYNAKHGPHPVVSTVGELKEQLARLPDSLPLSNGEGFAMIVFNYSLGEHPVCSPMHLSFEEPDDWNYDD